MRRIYKY